MCAGEFDAKTKSSAYRYSQGEQGCTQRGGKLKLFIYYRYIEASFAFVLKILNAQQREL